MGVLPIDQTLREENEALRKRITALEEVIEEQGRIIEEQGRIIEEWKRGHRVRPRRDAKKKKKSGKKKPGRKKGHEGFQRGIPNHTDTEVERTKDKCDDCHAVLTATGKTEEVIIENVIPARVEVENDKSRGHKVIEELLCELDEDGNVIAPYEGTVVSDFMGAYCTCDWMVHQFCWVHLLRDADKALEMAPDARIREFADNLHGTYTDALVAQSSGDKSKQRGIRVRLGRLIANAELGSHPDVSRLQKRCKKEFHGLLHFMGSPDIPAHNNGGELAARALVVMRKVIGGTRSERGTEVHAHFMSTSQTAHKQGIDHGNFIIEVLAAQQAGKPPPSIFNS